ncbi:uncharacterized protein RJT20DRAFT_629 [Scheffersomyces xylosifermentans]|uniref:uncharacterized protein n=1 Tax=Scheffersomyces xylosifermentans TaxID=1304137 RepID=UPI00315D2C13
MTSSDAQTQICPRAEFNQKIDELTQDLNATKENFSELLDAFKSLSFIKSLSNQSDEQGTSTRYVDKGLELPPMTGLSYGVSDSNITTPSITSESDRESARTIISPESLFGEGSRISTSQIYNDVKNILGPQLAELEDLPRLTTFNVPQKKVQFHRINGRIPCFKEIVLNNFEIGQSSLGLFLDGYDLRSKCLFYGIAAERIEVVLYDKASYALSQERRYKDTSRGTDTFMKNIFDYVERYDVYQAEAIIEYLPKLNELHKVNNTHDIVGIHTAIVSTTSPRIIRFFEAMIAHEFQVYCAYVHEQNESNVHELGRVLNAVYQEYKKDTSQPVLELTNVFEKLRKYAGFREQKGFKSKRKNRKDRREED